MWPTFPGHRWTTLRLLSGIVSTSSTQTNPLPYYVIDEKSTANHDKVPWIRQELGDGVELAAFCIKFIELFGNKLHGNVPQKGACLKLYAMYNPDSPGATWKQEGDIPPLDRVDFQRVWDPDAPCLCLEHGKPLKGRPSIHDMYCNSKCRDAGRIVRCTQCTADKRCGFCSMDETPLGDSKLDKVIQKNRLQMKRMRSVLGHETRVVDPSHVPAWKKRRA